MILPLFIAFLNGDGRSFDAFLISGIFLITLGSSLFLGFRNTAPTRNPNLTILMPLMNLILIGLLDSFPFYLYLTDDGLIPAIFESLSFLTTNGATAYPVVDQSLSMNLWRLILAWQGGFFAITFALSLLTALNSGAIQLHRSPMPYGDSSDGYIRLRSTARAILPVYSFFTICFTVIFLVNGHSFYNSLSLSVRGLSTTALPYIERAAFSGSITQIIMILAMIAGASNWDMIQALFTGKKRSLWRGQRGPIKRGSIFYSRFC